MRKFAFTIFALALLFSPAAAAQQPPAPPQGTAAPQITIPAYADSPEGLKQLVTAMVEATKNNDQKTLAAYAQSLRLPNPETWFKDVFGEVLGTQIAEAHGLLDERLHAALFESLSGILKDQFADFEIQQFKKPCEPASDMSFYSILLMRRRRIPLYLAKFSKPNDSHVRMMGFFAYVDDAFRFLGVIRVDSLRALPGSKVVRIGGNVQQAKLDKIVRPHYPEAAKNYRIQGTVRLHGQIGRDGTISALQLINGSCLLAEAAVEAVSQWRYSPTLLDGVPVIVDTTIDVVFTLGGR
ncbi:MAG: energy transducer TonB [Acidobacteria bacterium]|nr:energy transducer TonB [Acidobacteriota bacterium]MCL5289089.1 energy transducer TonB [Acidobacteriota bacterium]